MTTGTAPRAEEGKRHRRFAQPVPKTALLLVALCLLLVAPAATAHPDAPTHAHVEVYLGDISSTPTEEPVDRLTFRFVGPLEVEEHEGRPALLLTLPDDAILAGIQVPGHRGENTTVTLDEDVRAAAYLLEEGGPEIGERVANVTVVATRQVDPRDLFTVVWDGLGAFDPLAVRVALPSTHDVSSGGDLHNAPGHGDGAIWAAMDHDGPRLEFVVQPRFGGDDAALSDPPSPATPWLIVLGIVLVSGLAWAAGKKLETDD